MYKITSPMSISLPDPKDDERSSSEVISGFFSIYSLPEAHSMIWEILKLLYLGKTKGQKQFTKQNIITFLENLDDFIIQCANCNQTSGSDQN